ncbi:MAG TPA: hypothetical protein VEI49_07640 [Terriglobales bacterium]|nr:hypothetical protein [Terriglobales bacterium]
MINCTVRLQRLILASLVLLIPAVWAMGQTVSPELFSGLRWRLIGPFRGGRAVAVSGVPGDSTTFYFGAVNGGIWKTTDSGVVWTPIFDSQPVGSIGAIAVAPSDPKIIYVGTGESDIRSDLSSGNGVYKSVDGGTTWIHLGLEETRQISRIVIDPQDSNVVYVGALGHAYGPNAERGVYKSVDGGMHWNKVLYQGPEIGISDLAISSSNSNLLFAGTWHTHRPPWSTYAPIDGPGGGLYRSQDAGKTWSRLQGRGLPEGDWGRVGVAVASDSRRVYVLIPGNKAGLYRSDDGGDSWALVNADARLTSRAWYFSGITVDPKNSDVIYIPNVALYRSEDGGKTISIGRGAPGGDDYHQIWIDPRNSSSLVLGTDQGTTISLDRGQTWSSWYNQPTAQIYHVITDNQFPYVVYGAQQDSGSAGVFSRTDHGQITPRDWFPAGPSESGYMVLDPNDPDIIYLSGTYGTVQRFDRHTRLSQDITPWPVSNFGSEINQRKYRAPWSPVLVSSPLDPKILYLGTQFVMATNDGGLHWDSISGDLTGAIRSEQTPEAQGTPTNENAKQQGYGVLSTIAPSPIRRELIWAGSNTGLIHISKDAGKTWKDVTPQGLSAWSEISLIEASHFDPAVAYAAVNRSRLEDQAPYIYRTRDYGTTWQLGTRGISASAFLRAVREDPQTKGLLFAGTESGVYVSFDDGEQWQSLQLNLPFTSVRDLTIHGDDLVIATHGRSFWILDNITPLRQTQDAARASGAWLFHPAVAIRIDNDSFVGTPLPPEEPTAENPPNGAMIDYFLASPAKQVKVEILDAQQHTVGSFSSQDKISGKRPPVSIAERWLPKPQVVQKTAGMHRFVWNLAWNSSEPPIEDDEEDFANPKPPKITPGTYEVRLTVDGKMQSQPLRVTMDPRSAATPETLAQQFQVGKQIFLETRSAYRTLAEINSVQKQLTSLLHKNPDQDPQLKSGLNEAQSALSRISTSKQGTPGRGEGLTDATKGLASALRVVESGERAIPAQAMAVYEESHQQAEAGIREWTSFKETELPRLNEELRKANFSFIVVRESEVEPVGSH